MFVISHENNSSQQHPSPFGPCLRASLYQGHFISCPEVLLLSVTLYTIQVIAERLS